MIFHNENRIIEGGKLRCKVACNSDFKIGEEYTIDIIINFAHSGECCDILVNNCWFSLLSNTKGTMFPLASSYFFSDKEERKIKLQIIDLYSKVKN